MFLLYLASRKIYRASRSVETRARELLLLVNANKIPNTNINIR